MNKLLENKNMMLVNWSIVGYFMILIGLNHYQVDVQILHVLRELFTIPFVLAAVFFSVLGFKQWFSGSMDLKAGISFGGLLLCTIWIIRSFFV